MFVVFVLLLQLSQVLSMTVPLPAQSSQAEQVARKAKPKWQAAAYRGLVMGKSTRTDMLRVFGKPVWSGDPQGQTKADPNPVTWNSYDAGGEFPGELTVEVEKRSGIIKEHIPLPKAVVEGAANRTFRRRLHNHKICFR